MALDYQMLLLISLGRFMRQFWEQKHTKQIVILGSSLVNTMQV